MKTRKTFAILLVVAAMITLLSACGGTTDAPADVPAAPFTVGSETVQATAENASAYDPTFTVNLRVVGAGDDELFNGTVTLQSPTMWCSEFLMAALSDKGIPQTGIETGYVTAIGDYEANSTEQIFWFYYTNGQDALFGCDKYQLRDGDYIEFVYEKYEG